MSRAFWFVTAVIVVAFAVFFMIVVYDKDKIGAAFYEPVYFSKSVICRVGGGELSCKSDFCETEEMRLRLERRETGRLTPSDDLFENGCPQNLSNRVGSCNCGPDKCWNGFRCRTVNLPE